MLERRLRGCAARRFYSYLADGRARKKTHWYDEIRQLNNVNRALGHFDDFYGNVFSKQWPSIRLGLLSPPKFMAIPNTFIGDVSAVCDKLERMGSYNVRNLWLNYQAEIEKERQEIDLKKDLARLHQLDKTLESIAATKKAEEMDMLYQNAPTSKKEDVRLGKAPFGRLLADVNHAAGDFVPSSKLKGVEEFTFDSEYFASYLNRQEGEEDSLDEGASRDAPPDISFLQSPLFPLQFPPLLLPHTFENGSALMFPPASKHSSTECREYICINGASILPVIALDLKPTHNLLDLCAGPGTKALLCAMTMSADRIVCNDLEPTRLNRVKRLLQEFTKDKTTSGIEYTQFNSRDYPAREEYSRVLADVPCLNDRPSCTISENNIFKPRRTKERLTLVRTQREILLSGLRALNRDEGAALVYSTSTLSPVENDGVVMGAMRDTEVADLHVDLIGLMKLMAPFERVGMFKVIRTRYGVLVLPNTVSNFGPMYLSRIVVSPATSKLSSPSDEPLSTTDEGLASQQIC